MKQKTLDKVHVVATLPSGKQIGYRETGENRFKQICFKDGGEVPSEFKGNWTDPFAIEREIRSYVVKMEAKAAAEAKATTKETKANKQQKKVK